MVDFKYHVVSIVAVFLALAVGIVLGTNTLSGDVLNNLKHQTSDLRKEAQGLRSQLDDQNSLLAKDQAFLQSIEPVVAAGRLTGQSITIVTVPGVSSDMQNKVVQTLQDAGATVTGTIEVQSDYTSPDKRTLLDKLTTLLETDDMKLGADATVYERAAGELAWALLRAPSVPGPVQPPTALTDHATSILIGMANDGFIKLDSAPTDTGTLAVLLAPPAPAGGATQSPSPASQSGDDAFVTLAVALQRRSGGAVLAGPTGSAESGGLLARLRGAPAAKAVSGIDDADTPSGRLAVVFALQAQLAGKAGQFGNGPGASAPAPTPVPTPATVSSDRFGQGGAGTPATGEPAVNSDAAATGDPSASASGSASQASRS